MKKLIYFLILLGTVSCKKEFNPENFKGVWMNIDKDGSFSSLPTIMFKNDSVYLEDIYTYVSKGKFKISKNRISYYLKNDTLNYNFSFNSNDSTIVINNYKYSFWEDYSYNENLITYDLIGIKKLGMITTDSLVRFDGGIHLFKNNSGITILKLNEEITSNFNEIHRFQFDIHFDIPVSVIYLGSNLETIDVINSYFELGSINRRAALLLTSYDPKTNLYNGFLDKFQLWDSQIEKYYDYKIPKQIPKSLSREEYFKKYSPSLIKINNKKDINKLNTLKPESSYVISINPKIQIENYLSLKKQLLDIGNKNDINIRTEFNLYFK
ncbi:hypothetical protein [Tenacibaculum caenipelagi]|uniref:Uncharacterized protein n=1 Tax=Tenacibaculum caenipelagi TaxID=1325435 RepID=A0A4V6PW84_9FLAO|nr:hypothetical protein [Tenacibaculum caenipelagi]TDQ27584.1 hypothetical protein DFQ07_1435 [Tenacibaculum caenipelagi]